MSLENTKKVPIAWQWREIQNDQILQPHMCVPKGAPLTDLFLDPNKVGMPYGIGSNPLENGLIKLGFNLVVIKIFVSWCHSRGVRRPYNRPPIDRGHLV